MQKERKKITCHEEKSQPPSRISNGPPLKLMLFSTLLKIAIITTIFHLLNPLNKIIITGRQNILSMLLTLWFVSFCELNIVSVAINFSKH